MKSKEFNILFAAVLTALVLAVFFAMKGNAGNLKPTAPPAPTMVTLGQLSAQIAAISSPVEKVVRGTIALSTKSDETLVTGVQTLPVTIDPNRCVAVLSEAVASVRSGTNSRNGACLVSLTPTTITVWAEGLRDSTQTVSYQIIVYK